MMLVRLSLSLSLLLNNAPNSQKNQASTDSTVHEIRSVQVQEGVKLEVLDYGGKGQPLVFLAALGPDAHVWDKFAPQFTANHHVYAITRRGFGGSDKPLPSDENYSADRLGDDVLAVMRSLKIERPVLVGHSIGGEELSSIGSRFPQRVAGLIYLDAAYPYAFYDSKYGDTLLDQTELRRLLNEALQRPPSDELQEKLLTSVLLNEKELRRSLEDKAIAAKAKPVQNRDTSRKPPATRLPPLLPPSPAIPAIVTNGQKYTSIPVPILAIYALPHDLSKGIKDPAARQKEEAKDAIITARQADAFEAGVPSAHVVRLARADHYIFESNESDVLREMEEFLAKLH
jgi:pimeloyl-ACP methyl ester carboxylesterase